jgi:hypothetical protein
MFADIGYANLFRQAGLFSAKGTKFDAVATTSGGSWFSTQLFYSSVFYEEAVLTETPEALAEFVVKWMNSYYEISTDAGASTKKICEKLKHVGSFAAEACQLVFDFNANWADFVDDMLQASGTALGDPSFFSRIAAPDNRILPLAGTDLLVQTALLPNARYYDEQMGADYNVFLGYEDKDGGDPNLFTCSLPATFVVENSKAEFWFGTEDLTKELQTYEKPAPPDYNPADWEPFYLNEPALDGTLTIKGSVIGIDNSSHTGSLQDPFGGPASTTVVQIASTSSAAGGYPSPGGPSFYAQYTTTAIPVLLKEEASVWTKLCLKILAGVLAAAYLARFLFLRCCGKGEYETIPETSSGGETPGGNRSSCFAHLDTCNPVYFCLMVAFAVFILYSFGRIFIPRVANRISNAIFEDSRLDGLSVCSQWPNSCGPNDGQFSDGLVSDGPTMAANLGHWTRKNGVDPDTSLKLIVTNTNEKSKWNNKSDMGTLCMYFDTDFNKDRSPGDFLWNPGFEYPFRSPQIFADYLDKDIINSQLLTIPGSNMTTATISTTTIDNPAYGVLAGQPVDILLLNLNAIMTTMVVGKTAIKEHTKGLADMTTHIAFNEVLLDRVRSFAADGGD